MVRRTRLNKGGRIAVSCVQKTPGGTVVKFIELSGRSSESLEDAVRQTVERASRTIRNIQSVWVKEFEGVVENNQVTQFQVIVKVSFLVGEGGSAG